ncbi:MAG: tRNA 2-thiouridine(34) synthase MnmA [Synergistales bacterium]|nr:tRNA 2-thiouridine(34) synthase MnmA [Bacteroidales bacterium]MDY6394963.1 tRNA 2-thiouridine(34) synthase MnmA [Bacteroidales bacterium]MDY6424336.1 tRNA 2-thiouridine(34) synthase MnmA [Bacteroidales bacterium]MDY6434757.1 tRNA 2-thiouridine(34) synthase MnmA [Synergistales bacterium]
MNIAALVSGGVDSSVVVYQLKEMGITPTIFYIMIGMDDSECPKEEDIEITSYIAKKYGCKMEVVNLQQEYFDRVVNYTIETVRKGLTPNPDVMCNKMIKFGAFNEKWGKDFDKIATGHYCTTTNIENKVWLSTAKDKIKDQTDFLAQISYSQLEKIMFPVGNLTKQEVRTIAEKEKMPSAFRKDSQGICFLGKINYNDFIKRYLGEKEGEIVELETGKILGKHKGFWFHTIGQRKGLGLSGGPWFVVRKDIPNNVLYVSQGYDPITQYGTEMDLGAFHFLTEDVWGDFEGEKEISLKIRHTPDFTLGWISKNEDIYHVRFEHKLQGVAQGQFGVIYDKENHLCYGSGTIV